MTKTLPSYLRVHRGPSSSSNDSGSPLAATPGQAVSATEQFWHEFSVATGWRVDRRGSIREDSIQLIPAVSDVDLGGVQHGGSGLGSVLEDGVPGPLLADAAAIIDAACDLPPPHQAAFSGHTPPAEQSIAPEFPGGLGKSAASSLAEAADRLTSELDANRQSMRAQAMELAARAAVIAGDGETSRLADRIELLMSDAAAACHCDAAVLYLLDDDTQYLQARAVFGMSPDRLEQPPRELRGARGDLEAMVRDVVAIDDFRATSIDTWNPPEAFAGGICVVIKSADVPIGTMWLFSSVPTTFTRAETGAARLVARAISLELKSATAERDAKQERKSSDTARDVAQWQFQTLPIGVRLADDWRVDGMIESPADWATGWHAWDVLPDGTLMLAIAEAVDRSITGAMSATVARAAFASHAGYRHTPVQMLARVSDTLWQTSSGDQLMSMLYARLDPETGEGEVASAGNISAMIGNRYGYRPLVDGLGEPLNMHIDARPVCESFRLLPGETLLAYTEGVTSDGGSQLLLGQQLRNSIRSGDTNPLASIRRAMADMPIRHERGAATLGRG